MFYKIFKSCVVGGLIGLFISFIIKVCVSFSIGTGEFYTVMPELIARQGNELNAVLFQEITSMILGAIMSVSCFVYQSNRLNIIAQTFIHFTIGALAFMVIGSANFWISFQIGEFLQIFIQYVFIYIIIWIVSYFKSKKMVENFNKKIQD